MRFEALAQKGRIGAMELRNRIVLAPVNNNYTRGGFLSDESLDFYISRAKGGAGLLIMEATSIDYPASRGVLNPGLDHEKYLPPFQKLAEECHKYGAKIVVQLTHVGRQTRKSATGTDPVAPSPLTSGSSLYPDQPRPLEKPEIEEIIRKFGVSAALAKQAGLDGIELILGHGYLMNNFLTPASNQRTDEYGGLKGGIKFCADSIRAIKKACGEDYPVICRLNGDDFIKKDGNTPLEAQCIAQEMEKAGADAIHVTAGMRDSDLNFNDHTAWMPVASWLHLAERIKRSVSIPIIAVKRLTPETAEDAIKSGKIDFAAFGKQYIADPELADKILSGRLDDIVPCTSCCQGCYDVLYTKTPIGCMINQDIGRSMDYRARRDAMRGDTKVLVVGGGPAGCEAAVEAAKKGYAVTLVERSGELGGDYIQCKRTEAKKRVADVFAWLGRLMRRHKVDVRLNTEFSPALLDEIKPDAVIDASGAAFKLPAIEGIDLPLVVSPDKALDGSAAIGQYVAVVSCGYNCTWTCRKVSKPVPDDILGMQTMESHACAAGHAAADVAEELARRGKKVYIITARDAFVPGMGYTNRGNMHKRFFPHNITVSNNVKIKRIVPDGLVCELDGMEFKVAADTIVMSVGLEKRGEVAKMMEGRGIPFFQIGGAAEIGNALTAFKSGYEVVERL